MKCYLIHLNTIKMNNCPINARSSRLMNNRIFNEFSATVVIAKFLSLSLSLSLDSRASKNRCHLFAVNIFIGAISSLVAWNRCVRSGCIEARARKRLNEQAAPSTCDLRQNANDRRWRRPLSAELFRQRPNRLSSTYTWVYCLHRRFL